MESNNTNMVIKVGVAVCFQICTTLLSMDDWRGLSQTLLVLVRYNFVSFETIMDFTKCSFIGWGWVGRGWGGCAKLSNDINDSVDLNQVLQNATYFKVVDCLHYEFCRKHLIN